MCVCVSFARLTGLATQPSVQASIASAYRYIDASQIPEDVPERAKYFRHISKGGWPFSTQDHGAGRCVC